VRLFLKTPKILLLLDSLLFFSTNASSRASMMVHVLSRMGKSSSGTSDSVYVSNSSFSKNLAKNRSPEGHILIIFLWTKYFRQKKNDAGKTHNDREHNA